jgi:hypothetical protein
MKEVTKFKRQRAEWERLLKNAKNEQDKEKMESIIKKIDERIAYENEQTKNPA